MKIQCENCGTQHELDPPSWVVSSGRAFRFRCSACGHSQSVQPEAAASPREYHAAPTEVPGTRMSSPTHPTLAPADSQPPRNMPSVPPPALLDDDPAQPEELAEGSEVLPGELPEGHDQAVFLKQNGQIYMVRDWETLKRWIVERRVDRNDLVSEGGVRWEPIGSRADLAPLFGDGTPAVTAPPAAASPTPTPFPFGGETPFSSSTAGDAGWHDDDTEGIPTGLPPLPTEDSAMVEAGEPLPLALLEDEFEPRPPIQSAPVEMFGEDPNSEEYEPDSVEEPEPTPPPVAAPTTPPVLSVPRPTTPRPLDEGTPTAAGGSWEDLLAPDPEAATTELATPVVREDATTQAVAFDDEWEEYEAQPSGARRVLWWGAAAATLAVALALLFVLFVLPRLQGTVGPSVDQTVAVVPDPAPVAPDPLPVLPDPVAVEPAPAPTPVPVEPAPAPVVPAPPTPKPAAPTAQQLVAQGWGQVDANPTAAARTFKKVLDVNPGHAEANYGYGYVLLLKSDPQAATHLCKARNGATGDVKTEVEGLIASHNLSCP